ncbi:MacB family efflux pump subunit [uncultured Fusobacterium sp.]|uniref:MacB family efflux pump subunit n=1 Tax=uncultured Fusobacterium sp. TaxID=159267 RepID=UPI0025CC9FD7|nr:MacB family efflux pump subunit [uncultured Fusobacterium sp.]
MNKIIEIENVNKYYGEGENRVHILKNISFEIKKGEFIAIIGQSGSGKSTLMNILGCLDRVTDGSYKIAGREISRFSKDELSELRQQKFGFIFQRYNLISTLTALENVALPAIYAGVSEKDRNSRAEELLIKLDLGKRTKNKPNQLSGGQQQRVSIARALMNGGEIILADEPTGALDSKSGEKVMEILTNLHKEGHTIILVTHDKNIANYANRIIEIKDGEIYNDSIKKVEREVEIIENSIKKTDNVKKNIFYSKAQFLESLKMATNAIITHKMRSMLTMLGIIIGIVSIICVVALGNGSQQEILNNINSLGTNTLDIYNGRGRGDRNADKNLNIRDADFLRKQVYAESVTPNINGSGTLTYGNKAYTASLRGVGEEYFNVKGLKVDLGKLFNRDDVINNNQVVVIDENSKDQLFNGKNPIGEILIFNKRPLKIIGSVITKNNMSMNNSDLVLYTPYTTAMNKIIGDNHINSITMKIKDSVDMQIAEKDVTNILTIRHKAKDFFIMNVDTLKKTVESTTNTMKLLISCIACISLVVGGIGVMNIMLVSVTERTKEIGIRMAIGGKQRNILQQFLIEAILICFIGGVLGVGISVSFGIIFNILVKKFTMIFSIFSIVVAVLCSTMIGVIFGYMPAKNASELDPINALSRD